MIKEDPNYQRGFRRGQMIALKTILNDMQRLQDWNLLEKYIRDMLNGLRRDDDEANKESR